MKKWRPGLESAQSSFLTSVLYNEGNTNFTLSNTKIINMQEYEEVDVRLHIYIYLKALNGGKWSNCALVAFTAVEISSITIRLGGGGLWAEKWQLTATQEMSAVWMFCRFFTGWRRSQWLSSLKCRSAAARLLESRVWIPMRAWKFLSFVRRDV
jgi:hypothetical protein